ncbi:MAG TPA: response regulator, partial [Terriglobales bacterium]|nr:response regulator [Terriglobales bacterium]
MIAGEVNEAEVPTPSGESLRALLIEDNLVDAQLIVHQLKGSGFAVSADVAQTHEEFLQRVRGTSYDVILADYTLPQWR